ncbi:hypothetical protein QJQ45_026998 [Haematococcus lacustris]|nr:hypothetical protein QJQ45_026998 [Haematococcus lacustris]
MGVSTRCPASLQHKKHWQSWGKFRYTSISTFGIAHNSARSLTSCSSYTSRTCAMWQACLPFQLHQLFLAMQLPASDDMAEQSSWTLQEMEAQLPSGLEGMCRQVLSTTQEALQG